MSKKPNIIYTLTDEAPALATFSLLPMLKGFGNAAGISFSLADISLSGRVIAAFPDYVPAIYQQEDALAELGKKVHDPTTNIIKLPNISASIPQLKATIKELQDQGIPLPDYPDDPIDEHQKELKTRYQGVIGSAVNPVLREGNSDRRAPHSVKEHAKKNPHSMGSWDPQSRTHVASMTSGDFFANEQSVIVDVEEKTYSVLIRHIDNNGIATIFNENIPLQPKEILDSSVLSIAALRNFIKEQIQDAKDQGLLFSLHLKATMMKVSDPIIFGVVVETYFNEIFEKFGDILESIGVNANNGFGDLFSKIESLDFDTQKKIKELIEEIYISQPDLAMVNSDLGITNLHVPSDVIIDASMPAMIRSSGQMWNKKGELQDTKAIIPDRSYAGLYQTVIEDCIKNGAYDPSIMGTVPNVGLMAQKAEEYGSHDKTFQAPSAGQFQVVDGSGVILMQHSVEKGDIFRASQTKDTPIQDWVKLAVKRARSTKDPVVFWLNQERAHDRNLIEKVNANLKEYNLEELSIQIMNPVDATRYSIDRIRRGLNTISATGNVLRDYLTDLFPILELGTSAKMLSVVPLINGGGLFETGAGGSAPKHVEQFLKEGHLRWDSLGEFLALGASLEHCAETHSHPRAAILAKTLDQATQQLLKNNESPQRKVHQIDNRDSHFYLILHWARALSEQEQDLDLKAKFTPITQQLSTNQAVILEELRSAQGKPQEIGGYYRLNPSKTNDAMRPSPRLNHIIDQL